jgi:hypothetical protein
MKSFLTHPLILLVLYAIVGLGLGLADPLLGKYMFQLGLRPGLATAASINVVLPLLAIGLATFHQRVAVALLGAVCMAVALLLGLAFHYPPPGPWNLATLLGTIPPVLVFACAGYAILGSASALATRVIGHMAH